MVEKLQNMQDVFLNNCRKEKKPVTVYLVNGVKLQGIITGFDNFSLVLRRNQHAQLVYKHSIATVVPSTTISTLPNETPAAELAEEEFEIA